MAKNHKNRGRVEILPLTSGFDHWRWANMVKALSSYPTWKAEAMMATGILVRNVNTGVLAKYNGWALESVDQRKAEAALAGRDNDPDQ